MTDQLLPAHATDWMRGIDNAGAQRLNGLSGYIGELGMKWSNPQPRIMPHLIEETGLGMLSPYVDNIYELYEQGLKWLRVRGMPVAVYQGLGFIGYGGALEIAPSRRRKWHWDQLALSKLPSSEADLPRISGVVGLSVSSRTHLSRVYHGYDTRAAELSHSKLSQARLSSHSGTKIGSDETKWSFGTTHEFTATLSTAEKQALGVYIDTSAGGVTWDDLQTPWEDIDLSWENLGVGAALRVMARQTALLGGYLAFYRADGSMIGARRFKALHQVAPGAAYNVSGEQVAPSTSGARVYVEALTDFGEGAGEAVASIAPLFGASAKAPHRPGKLWLTPDQIDTPYAPVAVQSLETDLRLTKRTRIKLLLSF